MELLRRLVRGAIGANNPVYQYAARLTDDVAVLSREGVSTWRQLKRPADARGNANVDTVKFRTLQHPISIRRGTMDVPSVVNNCVREEYGQFERGFDAKFIIDAGAYIGDTAAYFLSRFPASTLVALEPADDSYSRAMTNLQLYQPRVHLLKAALWDKVGSVRFGGVETGASVGGGEVEVATTSIPTLLEQYGPQSCIDILKMDIEGAETAVLASGDNGWLQKVRLLLLETHGAHIEAEVLPLLTRNGFQCRRFRNLWYCRNARL